MSSFESIERQSTWKRDAVICTIAASIGVLAHIGYEEVTKPSDNTSVEDALSKTTPCHDDSLVLTQDSNRFVLSDARCRNEVNNQIEIYSLPSDSTLGPVAYADTGAKLGAVCLQKGQDVTNGMEYRSDTWIYVQFTNTDGITARSSKTEGFVNSMDVIGESNLPQCPLENDPKYI